MECAEDLRNHLVHLAKGDLVIVSLVPRHSGMQTQFVSATHILANANPRSPTKLRKPLATAQALTTLGTTNLEHVSVHVLGPFAEPSIGIESIGIWPKDILVSVEDSGVDSNPNASWESLATDIASPSWDLSGYGQSHTWMHPHALFAAGEKVRQFHGFVIPYNVAQATFVGSLINFFGEFLIGGRILHQMIEY